MDRHSHVLVVDDDWSVRAFVSEVLRDDGWQIHEAETGEQALSLLKKQQWSAVFCDVALPKIDGFAILQRFKDESPQTKVILMTSEGTAVGALNATAAGAYDYLVKPLAVEELRSLAAALRERRAVCRERRVKDRRRAGKAASDLQLVGRSEAFIEVMKQIGRVAATALPVLLTGESGTGKGIVALALHKRSDRNGGPFVPVNCGAIPTELIESELFGHVKGSFTSADRERCGLWEEANNGTIFLDEITETTMAFQVKLLRVLQEGEIRRVGSNETRTVNVRVVAASNGDVEREVRAGRFRKDLFYRLNAVTIALPALRERREDIVPLTLSFIERVYSLNPKVKLSDQAAALLEQYPWPGNVRELENAIVRAVALCDGVIRIQDLPECVRNYEPAKSENAAPEIVEVPHSKEEWPSLNEIECRYVTRVLAHTGGNKTAAARLLNVDRKTLERMVKRHRISLGGVSRFPTRAA